MRCINREFVWVGGGGRDGKSGLGILSVKEKLKNQLKISLFLMRWIGFIWGWVGEENEDKTFMLSNETFFDF